MTLSLAYKKAVIALKRANDPTAELDASILLEYVTEKNRGNIVSHPEEPLTNSQNAKFASLVRKRKNGIPISYILGHKEFFGYDFHVNKNTLIPRPESEELVSLALQRIKNYELRIKNQSNTPIIRNSAFKILDMGTGSGCIIISIVKEMEKKDITCEFYACDISAKALYVAKKNARKHNVKKDIQFYLSDLFSSHRLHKKYDIIIANLPYVPTKNRKNGPTIVDSSIHFEPQNAIFVDGDGSNTILKFLKQSKDKMNRKGTILLELDERNSTIIEKEAHKYFPESEIKLLKDLSGRSRYLAIDNI